MGVVYNSTDVSFIHIYIDEVKKVIKHIINPLFIGDYFMKSTRILLSLTLLCIGTHAIKAASSSNHTNQNESMWQQSQVAGYLSGKNDATKIPTHEAIEMAKETAKSYSTTAKEAKATFHKKIVGDKSAKQYGLKDALEYVSKDSKNRAAEAFGVYSEADVRNFLKPLAKKGNGLQHVTQVIRSGNCAVVGEGAYFIKPSSAYAKYKRSLPTSRVSVRTELAAKKARKPLLVYDATEGRYRGAQSKDLSVKLESWKPTEDYVNTWALPNPPRDKNGKIIDKPYYNEMLAGTPRHKDHKAHADYDWTEDGPSWKTDSMGDHTHGWILSSQSMTRKEKEAKKAALDKLIKQTTIHTIIDSKGNHVSADVFTDGQDKVVYTHDDNKKTQNNVVAGRNYQWKTDPQGLWQPATTYASVVGSVPIIPATIATIRNNLEETGNNLKKLLQKPKKNAKQIEAVRRKQNALRGWLNHHIGFLEHLKTGVVPSQDRAANAEIKALEAKRDTLISELNLSPAHAYYVQATIDAIAHNLLETNEVAEIDERVSNEIYNLAFGDKTVNSRTAITKACAEVVRNVPDSGRIFSYEPTTVTSYYTKQKELEEIRKTIATESDHNKKLSLIDQAEKIEHERNNLAQKNMQEARNYINLLIPTNKLWKDTQKFEGKMHDLLYVLAELNAAQRTKEASTDVVKALEEQLRLARGKTKKIQENTNAATSSSSSKQHPTKKKKHSDKGKTTSKRRIIKHKRRK